MQNILRKSRGKNCFKSGIEYQHSICEKLKQIQFNNESYIVEEVKGAKDGPDIILHHRDLQIGFEVKRKAAFEGGSKKMIYGENRLLFPEGSLHDYLLSDRSIYEGKNLPYYEGKKSKADYLPVKHIFDQDIYIDITNDTMSNYYKRTGVYYIQIEGNGIYHTGEDILSLGVPLFNCSQRLRIRTSKHKNKEGVPTDVVGDINYNKKTLVKSPFNLDSILPSNMTLPEE